MLCALWRERPGGVPLGLKSEAKQVYIYFNINRKHQHSTGYTFYFIILHSTATHLSRAVEIDM